MTYQDGYIIYDDDHEYMNIESEITGLPMKRVNDLKHIQQMFRKCLQLIMRNILQKHDNI